MSLLLRKIVGTTKSWQNLLKKCTIAELALAPPLWVVQEFMPTERDAGGISVFEVANDAEADAIAGAFALHAEKLEAQVVFIGALRSEFDKAWLELTASPGNLDHTFADSRHRDLRINSPFDASLAAGIFVSGRLLPIEGKIASAATRKSARSNEIAFGNICSKSLGSDRYSGKNTIRLLGEGVIEARGVT